MRHLLSYSVYQDLSLFGDDPRSMMDSIGCDGLELLTGYTRIDHLYDGIVETVHLPYATDWMASWEGHPYDMDDDVSRFVMYGRDRDGIIRNLTCAIENASILSPAHGVLHVTDIPLDQIFLRSSSLDSNKVIDSFCEIINTVVGPMRHGEPPFKLAFENLWWPGLRLLDSSDYHRVERRIEFDDWGICLDTGHMMNCLPVRTESEGIDALLRIFDGYGQDLLDRIGAVHFHWSASWDYRSSFEEKTFSGDASDFYSSAYPHIMRIDMHMPFSDPGCGELLEILRPEYVVHEMPGSERGVIEDFVKQRSLLGPL